MDKFYLNQRVEVVGMPGWDGLLCKVRNEDVFIFDGEENIYLTPLADRPDGLERIPFYWPRDWIRRV